MLENSNVLGNYKFIILELIKQFINIKKNKNQ